MRKMLAGGAMTVLLGISLLTPGEWGHAAARTVKVTLPEYTVTLNGHTVDNRYRKYPLLVYNEITYVPMTWYDSRLLGLETVWSTEDGLRIQEAQVTSSYQADQTESRNKSTYTAEVSDFPVKVNGTTVDNASEPYPLLSFRDVTYFPLTWRFAHDSFGWNYEWSDDTGLAITSHNPQLKPLELPAETAESHAAFYRGYLYFTEASGAVNQLYRSPVLEPAAKEPLYSYDMASVYGIIKAHSFQLREDGLWFVYHHGGATMGNDVYVRIGEDGKAEEKYAGYLDFRTTPYGTLMTSLAVPPSGNNLTLIPPGKDRASALPAGRSGLMYGRHVTKTSTSVSVGGSSSTTVIGEEAYILATSAASGSYDDPNRIIRINLKTNETVKLVDTEVSQFRISGGRLYYVKDGDHALYSSGLDGTGERKLSELPVAWFDVLDGSVYYTTPVETNSRKYRLYQADPDRQDPLILQALLDEVQTAGGKLVCRLNQEEAYGLQVLDATGRLLLSVSDPIAQLLPTDGALLLRSARDHSLLYLP
ncbi:DUF5050 domain-containing protein [Gorillibacterium sp. sgz5001074]|uniref:DUF5050 domain-containing protein n=1 Tax=Gorillibacterium sp. sgz5001074 TaxID=3446695 RepID=UPI003F661773